MHGLALNGPPCKKGDIINFRGFGKEIDAKVMSVAEIIKPFGGVGWNITLNAALTAEELRKLAGE